jgi:outer membrane receptor protein involved in Fe transport
MRRRVLAAIAAACWVAIPVTAQETQDKDKPQKDEQPSHTKVEGEKVTAEETVVVSASKVESTLINAPATLSVITSDTIEAGSGQNYGDLLRTVPGVNVIQMSARDINITSRQSTSTLSSSQLALLDGRSIYLDFFGLILWDFVPTDPDQIKQIEVVRGPASAVWGANALTGLVNIITKSPREAVGNNLSLTGGLFNRPSSTLQDDGNGYTYGGNVSIARAPNDRISWRLTAGYFNSDPYARPEGTAGGCPLNTKCVPHPLTPAGQEGDFLTGGAPLLVQGPNGPAGTTYKNTSTSQPKVDLRLDQDLANGARLTYEGGYAGSSGIIHTGIGPFDIDNGSYMAYGKVNFSKGALKINGFANFLDAKAPNLLFVDPATLQPVRLNFKTQTYDFEIGHSQTVASHHILSYGGNARRNNFDISLAPHAEDRNEFGAYFQDEIFYDKFRLAIGGRVDKFGNIDSAVFSPRITAMFKPTPDQSIRVSFNRAFRSPSVINNYLDQNIFLTSPLITPLVPLAPVAALFGQPELANALRYPFELVVRNTGNTGLKEESLNAYEIAYTGTFNKRTTLGLALYRNDSNDSINFTRIIPTAANPNGLPGFDVYTPANAPSVIGINTQGVPVPGSLVPFLEQLRRLGFPVGNPLPRTVSNYLNLSGLRQEGLEASINHDFGDGFSLYANYSYQKTPKLLTPDTGQIAYPISEVGIPAKNRFNAAVNMNTKRYIGSLGVNYADKAFWTDVLSAEYDAYTDSYAMVNAAFGVKWAEGKYTTSIKGNNIFNDHVQQHSFGDVLQRAIFLELRARF